MCSPGHKGHDDLTSSPPSSGLSSEENTSISRSFKGCQDLVRFFALLRIKPHAPPLVRVPVNSFEFQPCGRTPQAEYLIFWYGTVELESFPILAFLPIQQCFTTLKPSSHTRRCSIRLSPIVEDSPAASRRSLGRVSVPMWKSSTRLCIIVLVGLYPTN